MKYKVLLTYLIQQDTLQDSSTKFIIIFLQINLPQINKIGNLFLEKIKGNEQYHWEYNLIFYTAFLM